MSSDREYLKETYGLHMTVNELSEVLRLAPSSVRGAISADRFPIPTFRVGNRRLAHVDDVAGYLQSQREQAHA